MYKFNDAKFQVRSLSEFFTMWNRVKWENLNKKNCLNKSVYTWDPLEFKWEFNCLDRSENSESITRSG